MRYYLKSVKKMGFMVLMGSIILWLTVQNEDKKIHTLFEKNHW